MRVGIIEFLINKLPKNGGQVTCMITCTLRTPLTSTFPPDG